MANFLSKEEQVLFLNSTRVRGVQNTNIQYQITNASSLALGTSFGQIGVDGPQIGEVSISSLFIGPDPFIAFTGDVSVNGYLLKNKNNSAENYSFLSGYLTNYTSKCSIGEIPQLSASFQIFGNIGKISPTESNDFSSISSSNDGVLAPTSFKNFALSLNNFDVSKVLSYEINVNINRRPDFILNYQAPRRVGINWPIEVTCNFTISAADYNAYNIRNFPQNKRVTNVNFSLLNSVTLSRTYTYSFVGMTLISESYNAQVGDNSTVTLTYKCYLNRPELVKDNLLVYINASSTKSYESTSLLKDLTFNKRNLNVTNNTDTIASRKVSFDGLSSTSIINKSFSINGSYLTVSSWIKFSNNSSEVQTLASWDSGNDALILYDDIDFSAGMGIYSDGSPLRIASAAPYDVWKFITFTFDDVNLLCRIYWDKVLVGSANYIGKMIIPNNDFMYVGSLAGSGFFLKGSINKFMVYDRILSLEEISRNYDATVEAIDIV